MHKDIDLKIENLSKIEGHASLEVKVRNGNVESAKLIVGENKRFYEEAMKGKSFQTIPQMVSRICGTCSIAHLTCASEAIEKALGISLSEQTMTLRKLATMGSMIRDHAMHLYLFVMPDILGKPSVLDFDESQKDLVHDAFHVKGAGNKLATIVAGRAIHATFARVGYFANVPKEKEIKEAIAELKDSRDRILRLLEIVANYTSNFKRKTNYLAIKDKNFAFLEGSIIDAYDNEIKEEEFGKHLKEVVIPYSQSEAYEFYGKEYYVGALARLNVNKGALHKQTRADVKKYLKLFPSDDIYLNNLAQAIEMLHCVDYSIELLENSEFKEEKPPKIVARECEGIGVIEAPRGILYYLLKIKENGLIDFGTLVTPTAQNHIRMENDIRNLVSQILDKPEKEIQHEVEKLIRSYDPCMTCASNFLKIKWI
ncbi:MAG: nickel-dependent hydrogenase large subunit [Nanoarchaeota archaeon]|nr:nickel-dependent hydrogenase large subunit [Nanoarchaeota archaeon]